MKITGNGPVHPTIKHQKYQFENNPPRFIWETTPGLTIRQEFAARAMQGIISIEGAWDAEYTPKTIAKNAVRMADALIAELNKPQI